jgi:DNA-binding response OmpR family regulator
MSTILIIDDDRFLLDSLQVLLSREHFTVRTATNARDGLQQIVAGPPDLLILDLSLPDEDGFTLCRRVRQKWKFPIVMLTSRSEMMEKVIGLEVGADDYVTKPFEGRELIARIRAQLRRTSEYTGQDAPSDWIEAGGLRVDFKAHKVFGPKGEAVLTELEFRLLAYFVQNAGRALSREQLFESVWGYDDAFNSNSLEVIVHRLRSKLEASGAQKPISTVRGYGYRFGE